MIDQFGAVLPGAESPCASIPASATATARRPTPAAASKHGIWHTELDDCLRRAGRPGSTSAACTCTSARGTDYHHLPGLRRHGQGRQAHGPAAQGRSAPAAACPSRTARSRPASTSAPTSASGTRPARPIERDVGHPDRPGDRAGPLPGRRVRLPRSPRSAPSRTRAATASTWSTRASTTSPARSCTAPTTRCPSPPPTAGVDRQRLRHHRGRARSANPATSSPRRKAAWSPPASCRKPWSAITSSSTTPAPTARPCRSNYNTRKLAAEVLIGGVAGAPVAEVIRERQTFEHILHFERVPDSVR